MVVNAVVEKLLNHYIPGVPLLDSLMAAKYNLMIVKTRPPCVVVVTNFEAVVAAVVAFVKLDSCFREERSIPLLIGVSAVALASLRVVVVIDFLALNY